MSHDTGTDQEMPLIAHLTELRKRLMRCVIAIFLLFAGLFYFSQQIYALVAAPLRSYLPEGATMIATGVASPFLTPFKLKKPALPGKIGMIVCGGAELLLLLAWVDI